MISKLVASNIANNIARSILSSGNMSIAGQVAAILRKYGTDAHVYLPGIGVINGLTAGNYLDSAGTTVATVDNPVGLVKDVNGYIGGELVVEGDFSNDMTSVWNIYNGSISNYLYEAYFISSGLLLSQSLSITSGKKYRVIFSLTSLTGQMSVYLGNTLVTTLVDQTYGGVFTYDVTLSSGSDISFVADLDVSVSISGVSVNELAGIDAIQATTANKPILRNTSGRYWWDTVDGTDLLTATFPASYSSVTIIDASPTGQVTLTAQNIVGAYAINTDTYGRFIFRTGLTASELTTMQTFANRLAGV